MEPNIIPRYLLSEPITLFIGTDQLNSMPNPANAQITRYIPTKSMTLKVIEIFLSVTIVDESICLFIISLL